MFKPDTSLATAVIPARWYQQYRHHTFGPGDS